MRSILVVMFVIFSAAVFAQTTPSNTAPQLNPPSDARPNDFDPPRLSAPSNAPSDIEVPRLAPPSNARPSRPRLSAPSDALPEIGVPRLNRPSIVAPQSIVALLEQAENHPAMIYTAARAYDCVVVSVVQNQQFVRVKGSNFAEGTIRIRDIEAVFVQSGSQPALTSNRQ
jgi:hypothetical protein